MGGLTTDGGVREEDLREVPLQESGIRNEEEDGKDPPDGGREFWEKLLLQLVGETPNNQTLLSLLVNGSDLPPHELMERLGARGLNLTSLFPFAYPSSTEAPTTSISSSQLADSAMVFIPLYAIIFLLSVCGNVLVILTLVQNSRMRTPTNVFLLNLAVSDLLLGVVCMPFTLSGFLLRNFIFGAAMCKIIPYLQAVSVSVSAWTLVVISVERYYGICYPLRSRCWRSRSHAYRMTSVVWIASFVAMAPIAATSTLQSIRSGRHKCREVWPNAALEQTYTAVVLDGGLLVIPLLLLLAAYLSIGRVLGRHIREERNPSVQHENAELVHMNVDNISKTSCSSFRTFSIRFGTRPKNGHTHEHYRTAAEALEVDADHVAETSLSTPFRSFSFRFRSQVKNCPRDHFRGPRDATCQEPTTPPLLTDDSTEPNLREMALQSSSPSSTPSSWRATKRPNMAPSIAGSSSTATTPCENGHRPKQQQQNQQPQQQDQGCRRSSVGSFNQMSQPGSPCSFSKTGCRSALVYLRNSSRTTGSRSVLRKTNTHKSLKEKKRVIKMLFVVVLEFFLCWTPLYVLNTLSLFAPQLVYQNFGMVVITAVQLLAYLSSCCNPITYCFMNAPFRKAFLDTIACRRKTSSPSRLVPRGSRRFFFR